MFSATGAARLRHVPPRSAALRVAAPRGGEFTLGQPGGELPLSYRFFSLEINALSAVLEYNPKLTTKRAGNYRPFFLVDCFLTLICVG